MKKFMFLFLAVGLVFSLTGCPTDGDGNKNNNSDDGIKWTNDANGTLTVINNTAKDMVLFQGQTPKPSDMLGGVRALSTRVVDISDKVEGFEVGGYIILRGMALNEYNANKANLNNAKIEYSTMATYGQNKQFRAEISPNYIGNYTYKVTNLGNIGMELRKGSPDGEKIGYLPALASDFQFYADTTSGFSIFPVFVYYQKSSGTVTTLKATSQFDTITVSPLSVTGNEIQVYTLPADQDATWEKIKGTLTSPVAYVTITNSVANQSARVTMASTNRINSQDGFDVLGAGRTLTYEIASTDTGQAKNIVLTYYNNALEIPLKTGGGPVLKNGYDYTVTISGTGQNASGYTVEITESATARDLSGDLDSL